MDYVLSMFSSRVVEDPDPTPESNADLYSRHLALVLEVIPDVHPEHAMGQIKALYPIYADQAVERVIQNLFDDSSYPQAKKDGVDVTLGGSSLGAVNGFASVDRPKPTGKNYKTLALKQLFTDFPTIPASHVRRVFASNNELYAPNHIQLTTEIESPTQPFALRAVRTAVSIIPGISLRKGKQKEMRDDEFEKEKAWLLLNSFQGTRQDRLSGETLSPVMGLNVPPEGGCLECECCFSDSAFHNMIQCPDTHLFCKECMIAYASSLLCERDFKIVCMSQSGCKLPFPESELKRFLTPKLLTLYEKVKQTKEIEMAGLDGLEECPHCDFKVIIDNPDERLLQCQNEECKAATCLRCRRPDHIPKSCAEAEEDKKIDARHAIEEAMTDALVRKCPKCNEVFIKDFGCNAMTCRNCKTISCYVCRQIITGYSHFNNLQGAEEASMCVLWDNVEARHGEEVEEARRKAVAEYQEEHPELADDASQVTVAEVSVRSGNQRPRTHLFLVFLFVSTVMYYMS